MTKMNCLHSPEDEPNPGFGCPGRKQPIDPTKNNNDVVPVKLLFLKISPTKGKVEILSGLVSIVKKGMRDATEIISAKAFKKLRSNKK